MTDVLLDLLDRGAVREALSQTLYDDASGRIVAGWGALASDPRAATRRLRPLVAQLESDPAGRRAHAHAVLALGVASVLGGEGEAGMALLERALTLHTFPWPRAQALRYCALALEQRGAWEGAAARYESAAALYADIGNHHGRGSALYGAATALGEQGEDARAWPLIQAAVEALRQAGASPSLGAALGQLATLAADRDETPLEDVLALLDEADLLTRGEGMFAWDVAMRRGEALLRRGRPAEALVPLEAAKRRVPAGITEAAWVDHLLAHARLDLGDPAAAGELLAQSDRARRGPGVLPGAAVVERAALRLAIAAALDDGPGVERALDQLERGVRARWYRRGVERRVASAARVLATKHPDRAARAWQVATLLRPGGPVDERMARQLRQAGARIPIGPLWLESRIGRGGMGDVWLATHRSGGRVAVKLLRAGHGRSHTELFDAEMRAVARLDHPGVVRVLAALHIDAVAAALLAADGDGGTQGGRALVMELVPSGALDEQPDGWDWPSARTLFLDLLSALAHAHARGVLHLDIKPGNVLLDRVEGRAVPRLTDFGLAGLAGNRRGLGAFGTPTYMAPEQATAGAPLGPATDLYAFGCLAWWLLTGRVPRAGATLAEQVELLRKGELPAFVPRFPVPDGVDEWLRTLLERDPLDRFPCAADAAAALVVIDAGAGAASEEARAASGADGHLAPDSGRLSSPAAGFASPAAGPASARTSPSPAMGSAHPGARPPSAAGPASARAATGGSPEDPQAGSGADNDTSSAGDSGRPSPPPAGSANPGSPSASASTPARPSRSEDPQAGSRAGDAGPSPARGSARTASGGPALPPQDRSATDPSPAGVSARIASGGVAGPPEDPRAASRAGDAGPSSAGDSGRRSPPPAGSANPGSSPASGGTPARPSRPEDPRAGSGADNHTSSAGDSDRRSPGSAHPESSPSSASTPARPSRSEDPRAAARTGNAGPSPAGTSGLSPSAAGSVHPAVAPSVRAAPGDPRAASRADLAPAAGPAAPDVADVAGGPSSSRAGDVQARPPSERPALDRPGTLVPGDSGPSLADPITVLLSDGPRTVSVTPLTADLPLSPPPPVTPRAARRLPRADFPGDWRGVPRRDPSPFLWGVGEGLFDWRRSRLVGREAEQDTLWAALGRVHAGEGPQGVWVTAAAGLGRSALLEWLAETAVAAGVAWVAGREARAPGEVGGYGVLDDRPQLVLLDDVEPVVAERALARAEGTATLVVVVSAAFPPLGFEPLDLAPLSRAELRTLLDERLPLDRTLAAELVERAGGSPAFAVALLSDLLRRDALEAGPEGFRVRPEASIAVPEDLRSLWTTRLDTLAAPGSPRRGAWELAALSTGDPALGPLTAAFERAALGVDTTVFDPMTAEGWVILDGSNLRFLVPAVREALRSGAAASGRRITWHGLLADVLPAAHPDRGVHLAAAGRHTEALPLLRQAARDAINATRLEECRSLLDLWDHSADALGFAQDDPRRASPLVVRVHLALHTHDDPYPLLDRGLAIASGDVACQLAYTLGWALAQDDRHAEAEVAYAQAIGLAEALGLQELRDISRLGMAASRYHLGQDADVLMAELRGSVAARPELLVRVDATEGRGRLRMGRDAEAEPSLRAAVAGARRVGAPDVEAEARADLAVIHARRGEPTLELAELEQAVAVLGATGSDKTLRVRIRLAAALGRAGRLAEARAILVAARRFGWSLRPSDEAALTAVEASLASGGSARGPATQ